MDDLRERIAMAIHEARGSWLTNSEDLRGPHILAAEVAMSIIEPELAAIRQSTLEAVREKAAQIADAVHRDNCHSIASSIASDTRMVTAYKIAAEIRKLELGE
ncbi:MAG: hypothetical protein WDN46_07615 [Methylocella sp.]